MPLSNSQPWSQVEDDSVVPQHAAGADVGASPDIRQTASSVSLNRIVIKTKWALVPLTAATGWTLWGAIHPAAVRSAGQAWLMFALLAASGALILLAMRRAARCSAGELPADIAMHRTTDKVAGLLPKLDEVERHAARVRLQAKELEDRQQQLTLQVSLAEAQRRHAESIMDAIHEPIVAVDAFGRLSLLNTAAAEFFKVDRTNALRKPIGDSIQDATLLQEVQQALDSTVRGGVRRVDLNDDDQVYSVSIWPLNEVRKNESQAQPQGHGVVTVLHNVTLERQASRMKSEFVAHVAHELRTPLSSIRGYVELLVDGEVSDEATRKETYGIIQTSTQRLGRMIDNMLNISRIESGTVRIQKEPVSLAMVVKEAADMVRPQAQDKGLTLVEELTPVVFRVHADRDMMMEAVQNLLSNAVKYTPAGGTVTVRMMPLEAERNIAVEVIDSGVGIPAADLPHMFEKFFRVEANKNVAKGTGLGLNLVKHIVESVHKGRISLTSEVGKGSTFRIVLPLMPDAANEH